MADLAVLEERLKAMDEKLDDQKKATTDLTHAIVGNGKPGLLMRVDRLEQSKAFVNKVLWVLFGAVISLLATTAHDMIQAEQAPPPAVQQPKR